MKSNTINLNVYSFTKNINIYDVHYIKYIYNKIHNNKAINTDISELIEFIDFKIAIILLNITQIDLNIYNNLLNKNSNINEKVSNILREGFRPNYTDTYYKKLDTFKHKILGKDKFESNLLMCVYILFSYDNDNKKENAELLNLFKNNNNNDNKGVLQKANNEEIDSLKKFLFDKYTRYFLCDFKKLENTMKTYVTDNDNNLYNDNFYKNFNKLYTYDNNDNNHHNNYNDDIYNNKNNIFDETIKQKYTNNIKNYSCRKN